MTHLPRMTEAALRAYERRGGAVEELPAEPKKSRKERIATKRPRKKQEVEYRSGVIAGVQHMWIPYLDGYIAKCGRSLNVVTPDWDGIAWSGYCIRCCGGEPQEGEGPKCPRCFGTKGEDTNA